MDTAKPAPAKPLARKIVIDLSIMTVIGVVLAFVGPFGSFAEPLAYRLVSWVSFAWIGYAIYSPMSWVVDRLYAWLELPRPLLWVFGVVLATIPMTAIVWSMGFLPRPVPLPSLEQALSSYFYVFLVGGGITAFFYMIEARGEHGEAAAVPPIAPETASPVPDPILTNPLIEQLPAELGSDIIALEMEDHYVRVHTALGSELVLMRLRDATVHVAEIEGQQVHRSWWVARHAVEDVVRDGRNIRLKLPREVEAPVSRANVAALREAGWI
ncbi:LytTR family transcriptional regulator DNA-binding domain-containing protein [Erythrobacter sp. F6033]|uniref:LytTR family transcriptional regulator DNA-binding domain-containing protein n=1 Tax=Erythrobacter sp. F6033 TaxID=2926401 RepID=UPI001FF3C86F|nr:LytTR family transcriptional regulator DNA-binding domain-containing protein [Erythrobacter sp. F6033]MCK0127272.1 LytTR family transcriptional regulator DNA-binding domain-containing protein [Erythrobacter sp. F6033]